MYTSCICSTLYIVLHMQYTIHCTYMTATTSRPTRERRLTDTDDFDVGTGAGAGSGGSPIRTRHSRGQGKGRGKGAIPGRGGYWLTQCSYIVPSHYVHMHVHSLTWWLMLAPASSNAAKIAQVIGSYRHFIADEIIMSGSLL